MDLSAERDRLELGFALREYEQGGISLPGLREVAETIVDRWRDPSVPKPAFTEQERALWNTVWEVVTGCREALGPAGVARLRGMLDGKIELHRGGPELRP